MYCGCRTYMLWVGVPHNIYAPTIHTRTHNTYPQYITCRPQYIRAHNRLSTRCTAPQHITIIHNIYNCTHNTLRRMDTPHRYTFSPTIYTYVLWVILRAGFWGVEYVVDNNVYIVGNPTYILWTTQRNILWTTYCGCKTYILWRTPNVYIVGTEWVTHNTLRVAPTIYMFSPTIHKGVTHKCYPQYITNIL